MYNDTLTRLINSWGFPCRAETIGGRSRIALDGIANTQKGAEVLAHLLRTGFTVGARAWALRGGWVVNVLGNVARIA